MYQKYYKWKNQNDLYVNKDLFVVQVFFVLIFKRWKFLGYVCIWNMQMKLIFFLVEYKIY